MSPIAVVTGASAGVGRATARRLAEQGYDLALLARGRAGLDGAAKDVEAAGRRRVVLSTDMADWDQVQHAARSVEADLGPIDVWVNCAFAGVFAPVWDVAPDEFRRTTEVTYLGYVWGTMAALEHMRPRDRGVIVQVGSALAYRGIPLQSAYCGAKHAIEGFTDAVRCELLHERSGVRITTVQLPALNTPQFSWVLSRLPRHPQPVPPIYQPELAARAVVHAAEHPRRREYRLGASTVATIMADKVAAGLLDRYLGRTGFDSQQTDEPVDGRRDGGNLFAAADEHDDSGAHGVFDERSHGRSPQWWLTTHRGAVAGVAGTAFAVAGLVRRRAASRR